MLSQKDKKALRGQAQRIKPTVMVGKNGLTETVENEFKHIIQRDQLVKVKFGMDRNAVTEMIPKVEAIGPCECVARVGFTATFFKAKAGLLERFFRLSHGQPV